MRHLNGNKLPAALRARVERGTKEVVLLRDA
jgi:hypothetical protein